MKKGDPFDLNWQFDFFGPNYARLKRIKDVVDPDGLLLCISCVGSEEWVPEATGRLCRASWAEVDELS